MTSFLSKILLPVAVGAVALVLMLGLVNMMRGGSPNTSQKLMRLRVLLQFVAITIVMLTLWVMGGVRRAAAHHVHKTEQQDQRDGTDGNGKQDLTQE